MIGLQRLIVACAVLEATGSRLAAQEGSDADRHWLVAFSFALAGFENRVVPEATTIGFTFTRVKPWWPSPDISVQWMPWGMAAGGLAMVGRAGLALPIQVTRTFHLLPFGGLSGLGLAGAGGLYAAGGYNAGLAMTIRAARHPAALRMGFTMHALGLANVWQAELGGGVSP